MHSPSDCAESRAGRPATCSPSDMALAALADSILHLSLVARSTTGATTGGWIRRQGLPPLQPPLVSLILESRPQPRRLLTNAELFSTLPAACLVSNL
jgi:hypothetical protein